LHLLNYNFFNLQQYHSNAKNLLSNNSISYCN